MKVVGNLLISVVLFYLVMIFMVGAYVVVTADWARAARGLGEIIGAGVGEFRKGMEMAR